MTDYTSHPALSILALLFVALLAYCWTRIFAKAGFSRWLGVVMIIPPINIIPFVYLAFAQWPVHKHSGGDQKTA